MTLTRTRFMATAAHTPAERLTPEDLNLASRSRAFWRHLRENAGLMAKITASNFKSIAYRLHREDDRSDPLELLLTYIVRLSSIGVPESFFRRAQVLVDETICECYAGAPQQSLADLDREDLVNEFAEDRLQQDRLVDGFSTPEEDDAEADALQKEAAGNLVRARLLRRSARRKRAGLVAA